MTEIENLMAASELMHKELQNLIKGVNVATGDSLIEKSSVDFLEPYLPLVENVVE